jgi:hypothetical protein
VITPSYVIYVLILVEKKNSYEGTTKNAASGAASLKQRRYLSSNGTSTMSATSTHINIQGRHRPRRKSFTVSPPFPLSTERFFAHRQNPCRKQKARTTVPAKHNNPHHAVSPLF